MVETFALQSLTGMGKFCHHLLPSFFNFQKLTPISIKKYWVGNYIQHFHQNLIMAVWKNHSINLMHFQGILPVSCPQIVSGKPSCCRIYDSAFRHETMPLICSWPHQTCVRNTKTAFKYQPCGIGTAHISGSLAPSCRHKDNSLLWQEI